MGRPRAFDEGELLDAAAAVFVAGGYEGTSIDDLVVGLNVHRGSIYQAFGSKRGLFVAVVRRCVDTRFSASGSESGSESASAAAAAGGGDPAPATLDLLLVAALERGPNDPETAELVRVALEYLDRELATRRTSRKVAQPGARPDRALRLLSERLYDRLANPRDQPTDLDTEES